MGEEIGVVLIIFALVCCVVAVIALHSWEADKQRASYLQERVKILEEYKKNSLILEDTIGIDGKKRWVMFSAKEKFVAYDKYEMLEVVTVGISTFNERGTTIETRGLDKEILRVCFAKNVWLESYLVLENKKVKYQIKYGGEPEVQEEQAKESWERGTNYYYQVRKHFGVESNERLKEVLEKYLYEKE